MLASRSLLSSRVAVSQLNLIRGAGLGRQCAADAAIPRSKFTTTPAPRRAVDINDPDAAKPTLDVDAYAKSERLGRPSSPHFTIYQIQQQMYMSLTHRVTGVGLGALFYLGGIWYAVSPYSSAEVVNLVHSLPPSVVFAGKFTLALPIVYHSLTGVRHLVWDTGRMLTVKNVYNSGYAIMAASALGAAYLAMQ
ncbi:hypothetical protein SpCBS45565_g06770 [Spizellomyces sp. 'palustris']|nr:hypothetical protein SpCBS45565_g06770 [Spizellomyces sp. 'palustris']